MPCSSSLGRIYGSTFQLSGIYQPTKEDKERYRFEGKHSTNLLCVKAFWEWIAGIDGRWFVHCWVTDQAKVGHDQYTTYPMDHIHFWSILAFGPFWNNQRLKRQTLFLHQLGIPSNLQRSRSLTNSSRLSLFIFQPSYSISGIDIYQKIRCSLTEFLLKRQNHQWFLLQLFFLGGQYFKMKTNKINDNNQPTTNWNDFFV